MRGMRKGVDRVMAILGCARRGSPQVAMDGPCEGVPLFRRRS
jgi:hypothetical protein